MLTLQDCLDFCEVNPDIVEAIAEREHLPAVVAAELGNCLCCSPDGCRRIDGLLCECITDAARRRDFRRCTDLQCARDQFRRAHAGSV